MRERLTMAAKEMTKNGDKRLKKPTNGQSATNHDGQRNAKERKLTVKNPMKGLAALCQGLSMN
jgi:hypothetical protein